MTDAVEAIHSLHRLEMFKSVIEAGLCLWSWISRFSYGYQISKFFYGGWVGSSCCSCKIEKDKTFQKAKP